MTATITLRRPRLGSPTLSTVLAALFLVAATSSLGAVFGVLVLMAISTVLAWRHPAWAAVALVALVPINRFLILLVFHYGHSQSITTLSQLWKDLLILVLFARGIDEIIARRRPKLHYVDIMVIAFMAISILYLFYPGNTGRVGFMDRLLGFRADSYFLLAYFVGRFVFFERRHLRWLLLSLLPGTVIVAVIAAAQFAWPSWFNAFFEKLSFTAFINGQGGFGDVEAIKSRGISGVNLPRASSLLLGDLALAFFSILALAVAAAILLTARRTITRLGAGAVCALAIASIGFSITRSAALAAGVVLVVMAIATRRPARALAVGGVLALGLLVALASGVISTEAIHALVNPHEASVQAHQGAIGTGLTLVDEDPVGHGLGTVGTIGQRVFRSEAITTENWYLQIATEMGVVQGVLFVLISLVVAAEAFVSFLRVRDLALARVCLAAAGGSVGFFIVGNMLHAWEVPVVAMAFWLLAGIAVGARETDRRADYARVAMRIAVVHNQPSGGARRALHGFGAQWRPRHSIDVYTLETADETWLDDAEIADAAYRSPFRPRRPIRLGLYLNDVARGRDLRDLERVYGDIARRIDGGAYDVVLVDVCQFTLVPPVLSTLATPSVAYVHNGPARLEAGTWASARTPWARLRSGWHAPLERAYDRRLAALQANAAARGDARRRELGAHGRPGPCRVRRRRRRLPARCRRSPAHGGSARELRPVGGRDRTPEGLRLPRRRPRRDPGAVPAHVAHRRPSGQPGGAGTYLGRRPGAPGRRRGGVRPVTTGADGVVPAGACIRLRRAPRGARPGAARSDGVRHPGRGRG